GTGERRTALKVPRPIWTLAWSPNGKTLATGGRQPGGDESVLLWDVAGRKPRATLTRSFAYALAWSPDGRSVATGFANGNIALWDSASGRPRHTLAATQRLASVWGGGPIVAWSPNSQLLATGYWDGSVVVWNATSGRRVAILSGHRSVVSAL